MPVATLQTSPLVPGVSPVKIFYGEDGEGPPLLVLHGGWGCTFDPFNRQQEKLKEQFRVLTPNRPGYQGSTPLSNGFATNFHYQAAEETLCFMDALEIERAFFWGHSDGAVIAAILGFTAPARVNGLLLEAFHYYRSKPASRAFFEALANRPEALGEELCRRFALEFGETNWRRMITGHAQTWARIAVDSATPKDDLYGGRLGEIKAPVMFIHGRLDPRTEPDELAAVAGALPHAEFNILDGAGHSPHSEPGFRDMTVELARNFMIRNLKSTHAQ